MLESVILAATLATSVRVKSGTPQTARAWVAARADRYETHFDQALVVSAGKRVAKVRFRCVTAGCEFPPADQPDAVSRVDPSAFDVAVKNGSASIKLIVWTVTPETVIVEARPAQAAKGAAARFVLNER